MEISDVALKPTNFPMDNIKIKIGWWNKYFQFSFISYHVTIPNVGSEIYISWCMIREDPQGLSIFVPENNKLF